MFPGILHAEELHREHVKILFGYRFPPFYTILSAKNPAENLSGVFIDVLSNFKKSYPQYIIEYKCLPRARISKMLREGAADAFALSSPMFNSPEENAKFEISVPLWSIEDHLLVRSDSAIRSADISVLKGKEIAVLHGNGYGLMDEYFERGSVKKHPVYSTSQILELVLSGRVDGGVCNRTTLPALMRRAKLSMSDFRIIEEPLYTYSLHLLVKRDRKAFLNDFNRFINENPLPEIK
ncbi:transporter substrate-binding domain-containing protein [Maridesulfovibrio sp.]|uniref:substrate-binding periplasmic protein n=1 Tax=Maridesulfovibrio sp. TaxID=2795000 RepID=UPI002A18B4EE|nr:transporter substrate-binding domain-containing protein [Maridesulfovibrio sp.]